MTNIAFRAISALKNDPARFKRGLLQRIRPSGTTSTITSTINTKMENTVSQDLPTVMKQILEHQISRIVVYGDAGFRNSVSGLGVALETVWVSNNLDDLMIGAGRLEEEDISRYEAILVGGADVETSYRHCVKLLKDQDLVRPVYWVGQNWEFCGGTLPIPEEIDAVDIYLFNHFEDYFSVKDPLLVKFSIADHESLREIYKVISPYETVKFTLSELLPARRGPAVFSYNVTHPVLTRNRHFRWRVTADLFWNGSMTTLHGAHEFGPARTCGSLMARNILGSGSLVVTIPNYALDMDPQNTTVNCVDGERKFIIDRNPVHRLGEVRFIKGDEPGQSTGFFGLNYTGYGGYFWYAFEDNRSEAGSPAGTLFANHDVGGPPLEPSTSLKLQPVAPEEIGAAENADFVLHPYALPVYKGAGDIEFGCSFESTYPAIRDFVCYSFDEMGKSTDKFEFVQVNPGHVYADEILSQADGASLEDTNLIILTPNWKKIAVDAQNPRGFRGMGTLVLRNQRTNDKDVTEFQSCWRNLGAKIKSAPHWINPSNSVIGRTNVLARVVYGQGVKTAVTIAHGSGYLNYRQGAQFFVKVYNPKGQALSFESYIPAFTHQLLWLNEIFPDLSEFLVDGFGTCFVQSHDADFNCQLVTTYQDRSVSLQHLWGY